MLIYYVYVIFVENDENDGCVILECWLLFKKFWSFREVFFLNSLVIEKLVLKLKFF